MANDDFLGLDPSMKGPVIASTVFHIALFIITVVGLPFVARKEMIMNHPISIELVDISEITQTNRVAAPVKPPKEEKEDPPKLEKPKPPPMKMEKAPEIEKPKPVEAKQPEEVKPPPPEALAPPDPVKKPEKKKIPEKKKPEPTKVEKPKEQQNDFDSLLKNLTPEKPKEETPDTADPNAKGTPDTSQIAQLGDRLTISEMDALRRQLSQCWSILAGAAYAEELVVELRVVVNRDRTVQEATIIDMGRYNRDASFRAAADAARRALRNPRCTPLALPADKYNEWKTTVIRFDPREML